jgi:Methylase involved in ubiquinone/menaquinone biosynthesis
MDDVVQRNKKSWDAQVEEKNQWTLPVSSDEVARARKGDWSVVLTPTKQVPRDWFPEMKGSKVLALASGGGQQAPLFAAAGADVTLLDNSPKQLEQDLMVADRDGLKIHTIEGDMMNMHQLADNTFDFIFHPCSNCFVPDVKKVWKEAFRVLKPGGTLISGVTNPVGFTLDAALEKQGILQMKHKIPYSDLTSITEEERVALFGYNEPITFGHSLQDLIGGQTEAGFHLIGFYEDSWKGQGRIHELIDVFIATRALKPR